VDGRDVLIFLSGVAAVKWWQWTTSKDRPQTWQQETIRRKHIKARLARVCYFMGWSDEVAQRVAEKWPRAWL
jgi:nicotinamide riboside transporter PnuC